MPRPEALRHMSAALAEIAADPQATLAGALARRVPGHDWPQSLAPERNTGGNRHDKLWED